MEDLSSGLGDRGRYPAQENAKSMAAKQVRIRCSGVNYRQGFVEVSARIHEDMINLETWQVDPETNIDDCVWVDDPSISDSSITGNCEIEISIEDARNLATSLLNMIGDRT